MNTRAPSVSEATPQSGQTLTANAGSWLGVASIGYEYQWQSCDRVRNSACEDITGATTSSYTLSTENVVSTIRVRVSASEAGGTVSETSSATQPVASATAPIVEHPPAVSGTGLVGYPTHRDQQREWSGEGLRSAYSLPVGALQRIRRELQLDLRSDSRHLHPH